MIWILLNFLELPRSKVVLNWVANLKCKVQLGIIYVTPMDRIEHFKIKKGLFPSSKMRWKEEISLNLVFSLFNQAGKIDQDFGSRINFIRSKISFI